MKSYSLELVVVACKKREAIVLPYLESVAHRVHWTTDYDLPIGFQPRPEHASLLRNQVGHMRCFRGHQDALRDVKADAALVIEDDAIPNRPDWVSVIADAFMELDAYEVISLHGRAYHAEAFVEKNTRRSDCKLLEPKVQQSGSVWVQGSLAYIIAQEAIPRFLERQYDGFPIDIYLCNNFRFALLNPSPFDHGSQISVKSLID